MQPRIGAAAVELDAARAPLRAKLKELMAKLAGERLDQLAFSEPFRRYFRDALAAIQQPSNNWDNAASPEGTLGANQTRFERAR